MFGYGVKETSTTTGAGALTLSAVTGFPRFANAFATGDLVCYSILDSGGLPIECGIGIVGGSNTLTRSYPTVTWDGASYLNVNPTAVTLAAGTKTVICTGIPGTQAPFIPGVYSSADSTKTFGSLAFPASAGSGLALTANRLYLMPFLHTAIRPVTALSCRISVAAAAGKVFRLGLYRVDHTGTPTDLLQQSASKAADTTGVQTYAPSAFWLPPGYYATAIVSDGAPTVNGTTNPPAEAIFGVDGSNLAIQGIFTANGSVTMPNPFSGSVSTISASTVALVHLRV